MTIFILFVDDEEDNRTLGVTYLGREDGFSCLSVSSVSKALELIDQHSFDVIVTDYQIPDPDGLDLFNELNARNVTTPVILFIERGREMDAIEALNRGAAFCVQKDSPVKVQFQELIHQIKIAVDRDRTRRKLVKSEQRFRKFFSHTQIGSAILNGSFHVIEVNDYLCHLLGLKRKDLIFHIFYDIIPGLKTGNALSLADSEPGTHYDIQYSRHDGTNLLLRIIISPVREKEVIIGYCVQVSDVSPEKELQERYDELSENSRLVAGHESSIRKVLNVLDESGFLLDYSGEILYYNQKADEIFSLGSDKVRHNLCSILSEPERSKIRSALISAKNSGLDQVITTASDNRTFEWTIHPISPTKSLKGRFVLFCRDVTTIRELSGEHEDNRELCRHFSEFLPQSIFEIDMNGMVVYLNPHARELLQVTDFDLTQGIYYEELVHESCHDFLRKKITDVIMGYEGKPMEVLLLRKTGEVFPAFIQALPILQKNIIIGFRGIVIDLSDIRKEKKSKSELEKKYRVLIENSREIIIVSQDGLVKFVNPLGAIVTGYEINELVGSPFTRFIHPDDQKLVFDNYLKRLDNPDYHDDYLFRFIDRSGNIHWVKTNAIRIEWEGKPATLNMLSVITDLVNAQEALTQSESRLSSILNFLPDPTFVTDTNDTIIVWNLAIEKFLGIAAQEVLGKDRGEIAYLLYGKKRPLLVDLLKNPYSRLPENYLIHTWDKNLVIADVKIVLPNQDIRYLWGKATYLFNPNGEIIGAIESIRDISDRKRIEKRLETVNAKLNLFSSITHHDIRNQLSLIFLVLDTFSIQPGNEMVSSELQKIDDSATRILEFIDLARTYQEIGVAKPVWKPVMKTLLKAAALLDCEVVCTDCAVDCSAALVYSDPLLDKVFFNLIDNAVKYGSGKKRIFLRCFEIDSFLVLEIKDEGPGIPDSEKELIFSHGYGSGTGIGLFLLREILDITGMTIQEIGESGKGAIFQIRVPPGIYQIK
ncbi:MAG: PAS domain S-box protein [Methanomicrobiales archaeon]|nr:PAS domain S-box protein [Methanomicrobiales archaeon]